MVVTALEYALDCASSVGLLTTKQEILDLDGVGVGGHKDDA